MDEKQAEQKPLGILTLSVTLVCHHICPAAAPSCGFTQMRSWFGGTQTKSSSPSNSLLQGRSSQLSPHFAAARSAAVPQRVKEEKNKPSTCPKPQLAPTSSLCSRLRRKNSPSDFQNKGSKPQLAAPSPVCTRCSRAAAPLPLN